MPQVLLEFVLTAGTPRQPIVIIPARLASTRLPDKPLADIHGEPMIVHVWRRAVEAAIGPVLVACGEPAIVDAVERGRRRGGADAIRTIRRAPTASSRRCRRSIPTAATMPSSTCRAICRPSIRRRSCAALAPLADAAVDIAHHRHPDPVGGGARQSQHGQGGRSPSRPAAHGSRAPSISAARPCPRARGRTTTMSASTPFGARRWRASSPLPPGLLEQRERLEQLRALEAGMRIDVALVDTAPLGVDTPADLARARALMTSDRRARKMTDPANTIAFQGEPGAYSRSRLPHRLSRHGDAALRHLRGYLRRGPRGPRRAGDDPDRELGRRPRRRHPSPDAGIRPPHRRRAFPAGEPPPAGAARAPRSQALKTVHSHVHALCRNAAS